MEYLDQPGVLLLIAFWLFGHLLLLNLIRSPYSVTTALISIILLSSVYLLKPSTSDLPRYSVYFSTGYLTSHPYDVNLDRTINLDPADLTGDPFEQAFPGFGGGFALLSKSLRTLLPQGSFVPRIVPVKKRYISDAPVLFLTIMGLLICIVFINQLLQSGFTIWPLRRDIIIYQIPIILGSIFFLLGSQNVVRQFLGSVLVFLSFSLFKNKKYILSVLVCFAAMSVHQWMFAFMIFCILFWCVTNYLHSNRFITSINLRYWSIPFTGFALGCLAVLFVKGLLIGMGDHYLGYAIHNTTLLSEIKQYSLMNFSELDNRTGPLTKLFLIGMVVLISELIVGRERETTVFDVREFRLIGLSFSIPLLIYPELLSRYLLFYFAIEMLYIAIGVTSKSKRMRAAVMVVFICHAFAPNAINVLMGPEWLISLLA